MNESKRHWIDCNILPLLNGGFGLYIAAKGSDSVRFTTYTTRAEAEQARDLWLIKQKL